MPISSAMLRQSGKAVRANPVSLRAQTPPQPSQAEIGRQRQNCGGDGSGQNELIVDHGETAKDELAQTSSANRGSDGGQSHRDNDRHAYPGENHAQGEGQFHLKQELAAGEAHASPGLDYGRIDAANSGVSIANHRQQSVKSQRQDRQPVSTIAEP